MNKLGLKVTKCVRQSYQFQDKQLFDDFRWMVNEAIRIGIKSKITSKLSLRNLLYKRFKNGYNTPFINASQNILQRGMKFVPHAPQGEAMKQLKDAEQIAVS